MEYSDIYEISFIVKGNKENCERLAIEISQHYALMLNTWNNESTLPIFPKTKLYKRAEDYYQKIASSGIGA